MNNIKKQVDTTVYRNEMKPAFKKKADAMLSKLKEAVISQVLIFLWVGRCLQEMYDDGVKYGEFPIQQLNEYCGLDEIFLKNCLSVYQAFSSEEVTALIERASEKDIELSFSHFASLARCPAAGREAMIDRMLAEKLSANQIAHEARALEGPKNKPGGGRPPKRPTSPIAGYSQIYKVAQSVNTKLAGPWASVFHEVNGLSADMIDENLRDRLDEAKDQLDVLEEKLTDARQQLQTNRQRIDEVLALREASKKQHDQPDEDDDASFHDPGTDVDDEDIDEKDDWGDEDEDVDDDDEDDDFHDDDEDDADIGEEDEDGDEFDDDEPDEEDDDDDEFHS